jgi:dTDP-4-amino-4,6-dideoxygalactose transaminase
MQKVVDFIKQTFNTNDFIPLHDLLVMKKSIDSTFVSSVDTFEKEFAKTVGSKYAIATVNGTAALHISLLLADVKKDDEVITYFYSYL